MSVNVWYHRVEIKRWTTAIDVFLRTIFMPSNGNYMKFIATVFPYYRNFLACLSVTSVYITLWWYIYRAGFYIYSWWCFSVDNIKFIIFYILINLSPIKPFLLGHIFLLFYITWASLLVLKKCVFLYGTN